MSWSRRGLEFCKIDEALPGLEKVWKKRNYGKKGISLLGYGNCLEFCNYSCTHYLLQFQKYEEIGCKMLESKKEKEKDKTMEKPYKRL